MRVGKIIDEMLEPVLQEAQHSLEHGLLEYKKKKPCPDIEKVVVLKVRAEKLST